MLDLFFQRDSLYLEINAINGNNRAIQATFRAINLNECAIIAFSGAIKLFHQENNFPVANLAQNHR